MNVTTDVLIIGGGGSGLSAAISAATSGAEVTVLEKCPQPGGSTGMSVGSFTAANTAYQYRAGVNDSIELFIEDMKVANGPDEARENTALRRILAENAGPTLEWLSSIGVQFLGPTPEPPYEKPRMHNVLPNSSAYVTALLREARRRGVRIVTDARVDRLLRNARGEVVGAAVAGTRYLAHRAVVLATGDYSAAADLKAAYVGEDAARVPAVNPNSTGDGFRLGCEVGGVMLQMDRLYEGLRFPPGRFPDPIKLLPSHPSVSRVVRLIAERLPKRLLAVLLRGALTSWVGPNNTMYAAGAILVNKHGRRLANEDTDRALARGVAADSGAGYMIFDAAVAERFSAWPNPVSTFPGVAYAYVPDYARYRPDMFHTAATIEELAMSTGIDPEGLAETLAKIREYRAAGHDPEFGRERFGAGIGAGPYFALGPMRSYVTLADGGLAVDTTLRVTTAEGDVIPGLYAAGSTGQGGLQLLNHGLHIGWAMVSGRIAGRHAAHAAARDDLIPVGATHSVLDTPVAELSVLP
ncbi:MAG: FAD-dependent oxidoreductase [Microbacterium sp.]|uniref:FAD-dependent oxidoreductase n=1 Tax=Microbacterium sp. TaxID=51671 RepID=UPI001AC71A33|nr:FAD-dependent oxidoreductase [Microbacterium sp.]MBN9177495.1 FAD-dependent oxidoreductase [Microbacterium sp.]